MIRYPILVLIAAIIILTGAVVMLIRRKENSLVPGWSFLVAVAVCSIEPIIYHEWWILISEALAFSIVVYTMRFTIRRRKMKKELGWIDERILTTKKVIAQKMEIITKAAHGGAGVVGVTREKYQAQLNKDLLATQEYLLTLGEKRTKLRRKLGIEI